MVDPATPARAARSRTVSAADPFAAVMSAPRAAIDNDAQAAPTAVRSAPQPPSRSRSRRNRWRSIGGAVWNAAWTWLRLAKRRCGTGVSVPMGTSSSVVTNVSSAASRPKRPVRPTARWTWSVATVVAGPHVRIVSPAAAGGGWTATPAAPTALEVSGVRVPSSRSGTPAVPNRATPEGRARWSCRSWWRMPSKPWPRNAAAQRRDRS